MKIAALPLTTIAELLAPFLAASPDVPEGLFAQLSLYLDLLLRWNARMNLTAVRDPREIVIRHFGESLFLGSLLPPGSETALDLGAGAGFPGLPVQLLHPQLHVTLAESQAKKAAFLREVVRTLQLKTSVLQEHLEPRDARRFSVVMLRAVDNMDLALSAAGVLGERVLLLTTTQDISRFRLEVERVVSVPGSWDRVAVLSVPRGTSPTP